MTYVKMETPDLEQRRTHARRIYKWVLGSCLASLLFSAVLLFLGQPWVGLLFGLIAVGTFVLAAVGKDDLNVLDALIRKRQAKTTPT